MSSVEKKNMGTSRQMDRWLKLLADHKNIHKLLFKFFNSYFCSRVVLIICRVALKRYGNIKVKKALKLLKNFRNTSEGTEVNALNEIYKRSLRKKRFNWLSASVNEIDTKRKAKFLRIIFYSFILNSLNRKIVNIRYNMTDDFVPNLSSILLTPFSKCNLDCIGCESGSDRDDGEATYEQLDYIVQQAKRLNIFHVIIIGKGEPLYNDLSKKILFRLMKTHWDLNFLLFTNGTTIVNRDVIEMSNMDNLFTLISIDGLEQINDQRRGEGSYKKIIKAFEIFDKNKLNYGYASTVFRNNFCHILSNQFLNKMIEMGCKIGIYLTYIPIDDHSNGQMVLNEHEMREYRKLYNSAKQKIPMLIIDMDIFEEVHGCRSRRGSVIYIDGTTGKVMPCVKTPFAPVDSNLYLNSHKNRLLEILKTDYFTNYRNSYSKCSQCSLDLSKELSQYIENPDIPPTDKEKANNYRNKVMCNYSQQSSVKGIEMTCIPQNTDNFQKTCTNSPIEPLKWGLPKIVDSICPECNNVIRAHEFEENGKVVMEKVCPKHGSFKNVIFSNVEIYKKAEDWFFEDGKGLKNPIVKNTTHCPDHCGICNRHASHTVVGNIDLTYRCNLSCPVCFADSDAVSNHYEPTYDQVVNMLKTYRSEQPVPTICVQFSGGEPTLHPKFFKILSAARSLGFNHIQVATNGLLFANSNFAKKSADSGLHTVYLQFDGVTDDIYEKLRGRHLLDEKLRIIDSIRKTNMLIILVPTLVKGINDHQIGDIINFALDNLDVITGISFQPIAFTGRISNKDIIQQRVTLSDLAMWIEEQTGYATATRDWFPLSALIPFSKFGGAVSAKDITTLTCHPHCALCTYFFVEKETNKPIPVTQFVDLKEMLFAVNQLSKSALPTQYKLFSKIKLWKDLKKYFHSEKAPKGLTFNKFLHSFDGHSGKHISRDPNARQHIYPNLFVAGMHFMDAYNFNLQRIQRCVIHYSAPDGKIYPFCTYNSGPIFRENVKKSFYSTL